MQLQSADCGCTSSLHASRVKQLCLPEKVDSTSQVCIYVHEAVLVFTGMKKNHGRFKSKALPTSSINPHGFSPCKGYMYPLE